MEMCLWITVPSCSDVFVGAAGQRLPLWDLQVDVPSGSDAGFAGWCFVLLVWFGFGGICLVSSEVKTVP